ncbi:hypothetical protein DF039_30480 [Burkholderia cenocepacia]|nr:hypothetical protein DF039_30480 [Burkholderia cenocepacia]
MTVQFAELRELMLMQIERISGGIEINRSSTQTIERGFHLKQRDRRIGRCGSGRGARTNGTSGFSHHVTRYFAPVANDQLVDIGVPSRAPANVTV